MHLEVFASLFMLPADWKLSNIVPIPKESGKQDICFFRPISLLPVISKVLERHLHKFLLDYLNSKGLLTMLSLVSANNAQQLFHYSLQSTNGTRPWTFTNKRRSPVFFFDVKKSFDSVPHYSLLMKLTELYVPFILLR